MNYRFFSTLSSETLQYWSADKHDQQPVFQEENLPVTPGVLLQKDGSTRVQTFCEWAGSTNPEASLRVNRHHEGG